jgi:hypothetical protein
LLLVVLEVAQTKPGIGLWAAVVALVVCYLGRYLLHPQLPIP